MSATSSCGPCGDQTTPLDAANEPLTSVIDNFVTQFFGTVTKTVVDGKVVWALPCALATGVPANPRDPGESLACYFKRLLAAGVTGLAGATGATGVAGTAAVNAFTSVSVPFLAPTPGSPTVTFDVDNSTAISIGSIYFVETLGWLLVYGKAPGKVSATLLVTITNPSPNVVVGSLVAPSGPRGPVGLNGYSTTSASFTPQGFEQVVGIPVHSVAPFSAGLWVFIAGSGFYEVTSVTPSSIFAKIKIPISGALSPVPVGSSVVPAGQQGTAGIKGDTGLTGAAGADGQPFSGTLQPGSGGTGVVNPTEAKITLKGPLSILGVFTTTFEAQTNGVFKLPPFDGVSLGYLNIPQKSLTTNYTTVIDDAGCHLYHPTTDATPRTFTIPNNDTVAYPDGTEITIVNDTGAGTITMAIGAPDVIAIGGATAGTRTIAANGFVKLLKVQATRWIVTQSTNLTNT